MKSNFKASLKATSIIIGTIVGVGIFGLPYVFNKAGFLIGLLLLIVLSGVFFYLHLLYGEIVLRTRRKKRLVGYAKKYLGSKGKIIATLGAIFGLLGSQLAYLIVGGEFLRFLSRNFLGDNLLTYIIIFSVLGAFIVLKGLSVIANSEFLMSLFLIAIILLIFFAALPQIKIQHFANFGPQNTFLAYGVILYALSGVVAVPEVIEYLKIRKNKNYKKVIIVGTLLPAFLYLLFIVAVLGAVGSGVSEEAILSLKGVLGERIVIAGAIFGILAILTSFIVIGTTLMKILWYDYRLPKTLSWLLVSLTPLVLYLIGFRNFINVIGAVGAVMGGIEGILIIWIYQKAKKFGDQKPAYRIALPSMVKWGLITIFLLGILYKLIWFLK